MQQPKRAFRFSARLRGNPLGVSEGRLWLKRAPRWWPVAAIMVVAAVAAASFLLLRRGGGEAAGALQVYTVQRGTVSATVTSTGEVYAPRQLELSFDVNRIPLTELKVAAGQQVKAGDVLACIDPTTLQRAVDQAQADLTVAQDNLAKAKEPYSTLDMTQARLAVSQAEVALAEAQENLDTVRHPDVASAQAAVKDAEAALKSAQAGLVSAQNDTANAAQIRTLQYEQSWYENNYAAAQVKFANGEIDQGKLDLEYSNMLAAQERVRVAQAKADSALTSAQNQLDKAEKAYQEAQDNLAEAQQGPDALALAKAENQVTQAQYNLDKAKESLAAIEAGPAAKDVEVAQAKAVSAQATLEAAQATLKAATMVAPFDGTVISVGVAVGDLVSSGNTIITLADLTNLQARAIVDETDIGNVQIGQQVTITFDAFPGNRFQGQVLEVPLQGTLSQNILTYAVPVSLKGAADVALKPGMTANISIAAGRHENVLLVPAMAVQQSDAGNVVLVQDAVGTPGVETPVQLGLSDGMYVEVKRGLNEGDRVVFEYQETQQTQSPQQWMQQGGVRTFGGNGMPNIPGGIGQ